MIEKYFEVKKFLAIYENARSETSEDRIAALFKGAGFGNPSTMAAIMSIKDAHMREADQIEQQGKRKRRRT